MTLQTTYATLALLGASVAIAGCSHMSGAPAIPSGTNVMQQPADRGRNHQGCQSDGGITVRPCRVTFDANNPGPVDVTVTQNGDGKGGNRIRERDDCASRGIATIAKQSNHVYVVTAGSTAGKCSAQFDDNGMGRDDGGGNGGGSTLQIVNRR